ncbi:M48 family metalloprotease [Halomonas alkaliantarctica]|nr:M48 family metalloprotease [Halomonas alkaliantarctica]
MKAITIVSACALALTLSGCNANPVKKLSTLMPGSFDDEQTYLSQVDTQHKPPKTGIGAEADRFRTQSSGLGLVEYPALENYLNQHLDKLKTSSNLSGLDGRVYLSAEVGFSAWTSADGNIYIPMGMLNDIDNQHELAALLAHELVHALLNHNDADLFVRLQKKAVYTASLVSSLTNEGNNLPASDARRIRNMLAMTMVSDGFLNPGWSRHQEHVADKIALDLMVSAGYNPEGMNLLLAKLHAWEEKNARITAEREARNQAVLAAASEKAGVDLEKQLETGMDEITNKFKGFLKSFAHTHPDIEERIGDAADYIALHYRRAARPPMTGEEWSRLKESDQTQQLIHSLSTINKAMALSLKDKVEEASETALSALNDYSYYQNYTRMALARIRRSQNDTDAVIANADYGLKGAYPAYELHLHKGKFGADSLGSATLEQLNEIFAEYGKPPQYYTDLIELADSTSNTVLSSQLTMECKLHYMGEAVACSPGENAEEQEISYERTLDTLL